MEQTRLLCVTFSTFERVFPYFGVIFLDTEKKWALLSCIQKNNHDFTATCSVFAPGFVEACCPVSGTPSYLHLLLSGHSHVTDSLCLFL